MRHVLRGHIGSVHGCAVAPDASFVVSAGSDRMVRTWDPSTGRARAVLRGHGDTVRGCAVTPDAATIVSGDDAGTLIVWDAKAGTELCRTVMAGGILCVAAHPSSLLVATGDRAGNLCLAELVDMECGPLAVTAFDRGTGLEVRCPRCRTTLATSPRGLGSAGACPWCTAPLRTGPRVGLDSSRWVSRPGPQPRPEERQTPLTGLRQAVEAILAGREPAPDGAGPSTFDGSPEPGPPAAAPSELPPPAEPWLNTPLKEPLTPLAVVGRPAPAVASALEPTPAAGFTPEPTPPAGARPSLAGLLAASGLRYEELDAGRYGMDFLGVRAGSLTVHATAVRNELAFLFVRLPRPGRFGGDAALRALLQVSVRADYAKALSFPGDDLAIACEQPLALLTPVRLAGLARGLAALGDAQSRDLGDADGWGRRLLACRLAQAEIALDPAAAMAAFRGFVAAAGLPLRDVGPGVVVMELRGLGGAMPLRVVTQVTERVVSLVASLADARPRGNKGSYMRRLLEMNRFADVARAGLDSDGHVTLVYETPEVDAGLLERVRDQFGGLLEGVIGLEQGR